MVSNCQSDAEDLLQLRLENSSEHSGRVTVSDSDLTSQTHVVAESDSRLIYSEGNRGMLKSDSNTDTSIA